jgi:trehalose/maltose hydrolase-like predicted phosphorylase
VRCTPGKRHGSETRSDAGLWRGRRGDRRGDEDLAGRLEQHITSDIVYAVEEYGKITGDERFMEDCGYEMILDAALFWASRLERDERTGNS